MYYVYFLRSEQYSGQTYVGFTSDLKRRLSVHNSGKSPHTSKYAPWSLVFYSAFQTENLAKGFEKYLKTASGIAFRNKHFM